jgi:hypothetical protein
VDWLTRGASDPRRHREVNPAQEDAGRLAAEVVPLINEAKGESWYGEYANPVDVAVVRLCRLRRAGAGGGASSEAGDDVVRGALSSADPEALVWLASRLVSYMDEQDYPGTMRPWLGE